MPRTTNSKQQQKRKKSGGKQKIKDKQICVLVLGMHRSGTSALSRILSIGGAALPKTLIDASKHNKSGYWESHPIVQYHENMLNHLGSSWTDWSALDLSHLSVSRGMEIKKEIGDIIEAEYNYAPLIVVKEPRICRFAPFFIDALSDANVDVRPILIIRNPLEVCASLEKRNKMARTDAALLWLRHMLDAEKATRNVNRVVVTYNQLLCNWKAVYRKISDNLELNTLCASAEIAPQVENFLSSSLRHHTYTTEDVSSDPELSDWVCAAYEALLVLVHNPSSQKAYSSIDKISTEFNRASPILRRILDAKQTEQVGEIGRFKKTLSELEAKTKKLPLLLSDRDREILTRQRNKTSYEFRITELTETITQCRSHIVKLNEARVQSNDEIRKIQTTLAEAIASKRKVEERTVQLTGKVDALSARIRESKRKHDELGRTLQPIENDRDKYAVSFRQTRQALDAMTSTLSWKITLPLRFVRTKQMNFWKFITIISSGVKFGGGVFHTLSKAKNIFNFEGIHGLKKRYRILADHQRRHGNSVRREHFLGTDIQHSSRSDPDLQIKSVPVTKWRENAPVECDYFTPPQRFPAFDAWRKLNDRSAGARLHVRKSINSLISPVFFSVVTPVYDPPVNILEECIESCLAQSYKNFELILIDDKSTSKEILPLLRKWQKLDSRVRVIERETNGHISAATNDGAKAARGEFLVFLDNDDKFDNDALAYCAEYISRNKNTDILYSDHVKIDEKGDNFSSPMFKPDWSPETLLSYCYVSHLKLIRADLYQKIGGSRIGFEGSQDHDMLLRASEKARHIGHIPQLLYHRRVLPTSTAYDGRAKPYSFEAGRRAVEESFHRRGVSCEVIHAKWAKARGWGIFEPVMPDNGPSVAIIIPTKNNYRLLKQLLKSIQKTAYQNYKIYIIDNMSDEADSIKYLNSISQRIFRIANPSTKFSFAHLNNRAVDMVTEDYILFLNNDIEVLNSRWLSQMVGWAQLDGVGAVGARLMFPDGRVQHGGVVLGLRNGLTAYRGLPGREVGYFFGAKATRNCSAVTAACMLTKREDFLALGGFDEKRFAVAYNDVDYCLRLQDRGLRIVYCAEAELLHDESSSRVKKDNPAEIAGIKSKMKGRRDPYYNPHLGRDDNRYSLKPSAVPSVELGRKLRILAVSHNLNFEGAPQSACELLCELKNRDFADVTVIAPRDGPLRKYYEEQGIEVTILPKNLIPVSAPDLINYQAKSADLGKTMRFDDFDVVYVNTATCFWAIDAAYAANVPSVWNIRESEMWTNYYSNFPLDIAKTALSAFSKPYRVVFVAKSTRVRWQPMDELGIFDVIHNGLNVDRFLEKLSHYTRAQSRISLGIAPDDVVILSVGTFCPRKGQYDLIEAFYSLPKSAAKHAKILLVGETSSEYSEAISKAIELLPADRQKNITVVPVTGETEKYWKAADLFVCTSYMESYPRVILEAMALELPILTTPVFGIREQVRNGVNALFFNEGNIKQLTEKLEKLITNPHIRDSLASNSLDVLKSLQDFEGMVDEYAQILMAATFSSVPRR